MLSLATLTIYLSTMNPIKYDSAILASGENMTTCCIIGNDSLVIGTSLGKISIWSFSKKGVVSSFQTMNTQLYSFAPGEGKHKVFAKAGAKAIISIDLLAKSHVEVLRSTSSIYAFSLSHDKKRIVTSHGDGSVRFCNISDGIQTELPKPSFLSRPKPIIACFSPNNLFIAAGYDQVQHPEDFSLHCWDGNKLKHSHQACRNSLSLSAIAFNPKQPCLLSFSPGDSCIQQCNLLEKERVFDLIRLPSSPRYITYSHDGSRIVCYCSGGEVGILINQRFSTIYNFDHTKTNLLSIGLSEDNKLLSVLVFDSTTQSDRLYVFSESPNSLSK